MKTKIYNLTDEQVEYFKDVFIDMKGTNGSCDATNARLLSKIGIDGEVLKCSIK